VGALRKDEYELQKAVVLHVRRRAPGLLYWHTPNQGARSLKTVMALRAMGFKKGIPDLFFFKKGTLFGLELKILDGSATSDQLEVVDQIKAEGGKAEITYGLDHALATLEAWGLIRAEIKV
jgi:hypothetical protein